jgi:hypothetical protein
VKPYTVESVGFHFTLIPSNAGVRESGHSALDKTALPTLLVEKTELRERER